MTEPLWSAHIGYMYADRPLQDRVAAARQSGFTAVEHPDPTAVPSETMRRLLADNGLKFSQMAATLGDGAKGEKGIAALPGRELEFRDQFRRAADYAEAIGCPLIHPMSGMIQAAPEVASVYRDNIGFAVQECSGRKLTVMIEAISRNVIPGYFMSSLDDALAISTQFEAGELMILLDVYHASADGADWKGFLQTHTDRIAHLHVADYPGRHEPGSGTIDFSTFLGLVKALGYAGAVGFEYVPSRLTEKTVGWLEGWKRSFQEL